jgi:TnpA family transposase
LDNQTELEILEHTTDTAGYTEIIFALFDLLGLRFSPRIKDLPDQSLYRLNRQVKYQNIEPLLKGTINTKLILAHYDDLLRLAGSLKLGWVTASLIISKLQAHPRQNSLTRALVEYRRLIKTRFVLRYLLSENVRKEINLQLNKGEAMHALRRFIFFANGGKIRKSQDDVQTNQAGSLNLMTNAVVIWNTVYMQQVINQLKVEGYEINEDDLKHLSPARHEHINPYGKYEFNVEEELNRKCFIGHRLSPSFTPKTIPVYMGIQCLT